MKALIQTGSSGRVPVSLEKRFLINSRFITLGAVMVCALAANADLQTIVDGMSNAVNTRISGLAGGEPFMQMFSTKNHTTTNYVRNTAMWAYDLTDQLTACAVYKDTSYESYGGILITPRHVLYCRHAHPQALGTWPVNPDRPCDLRFVDSDNNPIVVSQLHQASDSSVDLAVGLLDRNMEELGLHVMPISPVKITSATLTGAGVTVSSLPMLGMSQGSGRNTTVTPPAPYSEYPQYNDIMFYIKDLYSLGSTPDKPYSHFNYGVWDGDSGTPTFILYNNTLYLHTILTSTPWYGPNVTDHIDHINSLIAQADQNAIGLGRLDAPTGYTIKNHVTLTFDSASGSDVPAIMQNYGTAVTPPADPTRPGYTFAGWDPAFPEIMPAEDVTLTAQWARYTYANGFVSDSFEAPEGASGLPIGEYKRVISGVDNETTNVVWYAVLGDDSVLVPANAAYADIEGDGPITNETSSLILYLATGGSFLSRIAGVSFASAPVYMDTLIQFTCDDASTATNEDVKIALFSTAQSNLVVRHMYMDAIPASVSHVTNTVLDLGYPIDPSKWYRLSLEIKDIHNGLFATRIYMDGSPISNAHAFTDDESPVPGGSYFINMVQDSTVEFVSLIGTGYLDELVVSGDMPIFGSSSPANILTLVASGGTVAFSVDGTPVIEVESGTEVEIEAADDWYVISAVTGPIDQDLSASLPAKAVTNVLTASSDCSVTATVQLVSGIAPISDLAVDVDMSKLAAWAMAQDPVKGEGDIMADDLDDYLLNVETDTNARIEIKSIAVDKSSGTTTITVGASTALVDFTDINGTVKVYSTDDLATAFAEVTSVNVTIIPTTPLVTIEIEEVADQFLKVVVK